jgi:hypothetical protein
VSNKQDNSDSGFLKSVFGAGGLITAFIFVVGWTYLHSYFQYFGINTNNLDFSLQQYLVFCFVQLVAFEWWRSVIFALMVLAFFLITWAGVIAQRRLVAVFSGIGCLVLFWLGFALAQWDAGDAARIHMAEGSSLPLISIQFKQDIQYKYAAVKKTAECADLRLLLESGDRMYVFVPIDSTKGCQCVSVRGPQVCVLELDKRDTQVSMRMTAVNDRKE